jgi:GNAT superfamily N-acetyltransferase
MSSLASVKIQVIKSLSHEAMEKRCEIVIRRAERRDCPRITELVKRLAEYERAPEEVTVSPDHFEQSGFGPAPVWWAFVAEIDGRIEGFALWYIRYSTWKGQRMYLEDLYVEPRFRGRGIGAGLFERLLEEAREKKFNGMVWQVLDWNEPALHFYRKYGAGFDYDWVNCSLNF